ncbi:Uncharacterized protein APZ42_009030, partial [Daphnia magna]
DSREFLHWRHRRIDLLIRRWRRAALPDDGSSQATNRRPQQ